MKLLSIIILAKETTTSSSSSSTTTLRTTSYCRFLFFILACSGVLLNLIRRPIITTTTTIATRTSNSASTTTIINATTTTNGVLHHDPSQQEQQQQKQQQQSSSQTTDGTFPRRTQPLSPLLLLDPIVAFEEWKQYHTIDKLRREIPNNTRNSSSSSSSVQYHDHNRKYMIIQYSCPRQAGIQTISFLRQVLLGIVTNRTLLYQYIDFSGWTTSGENAPAVCDSILKRANWLPTFDDDIVSQYILPTLGEPTKVSIIAANSGDHDKETETAMSLMEQGVRIISDYSNDPIIIMKGIDDKKELVYGKVLDLLNPYMSMLLSQALLGITTNTTTDTITDTRTNDYDSQQQQHHQQWVIPFHEQTYIRRLYSEGIMFLHGMLFHQIFTYTNEFINSIQMDTFHNNNENNALLPLSSSMSSLLNDNDNNDNDNNDNDNNDGSNNNDIKFRIGIHSRHTNPKDDGSNIHREIACINQILDAYNNNDDDDDEKNKKRECVIYIMADRETTIVNLINQASNDESQHNNNNFNCTIIRTSQQSTITDNDNNNHNNNATISSTLTSTTTSIRSHPEHGPFAGAGYFQDIVMVSNNAHSAYISSFRSSSLLPLMLIEYNRRIQQYNYYAYAQQQPHDTTVTTITPQQQQQQQRTNLHDIPVCHLKKVKLPRRAPLNDKKSSSRRRRTT